MSNDQIRVIRVYSASCHFAASVVLLVYSISHLLFFFVPDVSLYMSNPIFPFVYNSVIILVASVVEFGVAWIVYRLRGNRDASLLLLGFVVLMLWYRGSLWFLHEDTSCSCLGYLGRLYGVTKNEEAIIPVLTLIFLCACSLPIATIMRWPRLLGKYTLLFSLALPFVVANASWGKSLVVSGKVSAVYRDPVKGVEYIHDRQESNFSLIVENGELRLWLRDAIDQKREGFFLLRKGETIYAIKSRRSTVSTDKEKPNKDEIKTIIDSVEFPALNDYDYLAVIPLWLAFGLRREFWGDEEHIHARDFPLPWFFSRDNLKSFGYIWQPIFRKGAQYLDEVSVRRDSAQDLNLADEFKRPMFDRPDSVSGRNHALVGLRLRKEIPNGFEIARYRTLEWASESDGKVPRRGEFLVKFGSSGRYNFTWLTYTFEVQSISVNSSLSDHTVENLEGFVRVQDYRYRIKNDQHFIPFGERVFPSGVSISQIRLKPEAESGVRLTEVATSDWSYRRIICYVILASLLFSSVLFVVKRRKHTI
jgi:hypothetical protein